MSQVIAFGLTPKRRSMGIVKVQVYKIPPKDAAPNNGARVEKVKARQAFERAIREFRQAKAGLALEVAFLKMRRARLRLEESKKR
jgi:hypothetical protein